jgi:hypothetical protein
MMRIGQASLRAYGEVAQDKDDQEQEPGEDVYLRMELHGITGTAGIEACGEDSKWHKEQKDESSKYSVREDNVSVLA